MTQCREDLETGWEKGLDGKGSTVVHASLAGSFTGIDPFLHTDLAS